MKVLIVNLYFKIGGVETILTKLIPEFSSRGHKVKLLLLQNRVDDELIKLIRDHCEIIFLKDLFPFGKKKIQKLLGGEFDVVLHTIGRALITGTWLFNRMGIKSSKHLILSLQTELFCPDPIYYHNRLLLKLMRDDVPASSIIFGNQAALINHQKKLGIDLSESRIVKLFIDTSQYVFSFKEMNSIFKIVSIGRIVEFKTYNFTMIDVIKKLLENGYQIEWHIYGDGEKLIDLKKEINANGLHLNIFLHGAIKYSNFQKVLQDADIFVGSGISLVEAAACGVPALSTIEYSKNPESYGFICDIQGQNLIEPGLDLPIYNIKDLIENYISASHEEKLSIATRCEEKTKEYAANGVVEQYIEIFNRAHSFPLVVNKFEIVLSILSYFKFLIDKYSKRIRLLS